MEPQIYNAFICRVFMAIASDEISENLLEFRRHLAAPKLTEKFVKLTTISAAGSVQYSDFSSVSGSR
jgi:hypothetical protein